MFSANASQVSNDVKYIEDFCSVYLRTGTGSSQTVTTGVKENTGVLVISKSRSAATDWAWYDTFRGATKELASNTTAAEITQSQGLTSFNTDGHTWGTLAKVNTSGATYVDFVLKPTPKFFDVVTYTGTGSAQNIAHNLGSVPGCIIVKRTDSTSDWFVFHRKNGVANQAVSGFQLNATNAAVENAAPQQSATTFNTGFVLNSSFASPNVSGATYVAYLFAHNAGGFGLTGTDNVISCGSYVGAATDVSVSLGYEPQWLMVKNATNASSWLMMDTLRGMPVGADGNTLAANSSAAENGVFGADNILNPTATGFIAKSGKTASNENGSTHIYIAIRRGPMKTPTSGTSVFAPVRYTTSPEGFITGFPVDFGIAGNAAGTDKWYWQSRLQGAVLLNSASTAAEVGSGSAKFDMMNGYGTGFSTSYWTDAFRRAPGFFDVVCYNGNSVSGRNITHNLTVSPEFVVIKARTKTDDWVVRSSAFPTHGANGIAYLNLSGAASNAGYSYVPTTTTFQVESNNNQNGSGYTYVAYLFATCPGVSKVGTYTGTGTTQQINCGFTSGARFIMVKSTSTTGDWIVVDTARGLVSGNDPTLALNSTAAEVTTNDWFDPYSAGFELSSVSGNLANTNGTSYIYLAIA